jgi:hypothetical protein
MIFDTVMLCPCSDSPRTREWGGEIDIMNHACAQGKGQAQCRDTGQTYAEMIAAWADLSPFHNTMPKDGRV